MSAQKPRGFSINRNRPNVKWKINQLGNNCFTVDIPAIENDSFKTSIWEMSDWHWDSPKCWREKLGEFLEQAASAGEIVHVKGDIFDAMGGKYDPRSCKAELRQEFHVANYLDELVNQLAAWLIKNKFHYYLGVLCDGNHETSIKKRWETSLIERVIALINNKGANAKYGMYAGFIKHLFHYPKNRSGSSIVNGYHHGSGLKSKSSILRYANANCDADYFTFGHHHDFAMEYIARKRLTAKMAIYHDKQLILANPSMKNDHGINGDGSSGWSVEKGITIKPMGCWKINVYHSYADRRMKFKPEPMD